MINRFFLFSIVFLSGMNGFLTSAEWKGPNDIFTAKSIQNPVIGVDDAGNAVVLATASDDLKTFYEQIVQVVDGMPKAQNQFLPAGFNANSHALSVNSKGNAAAVWTEINNEGNYYLRGTTLFDNSWSNVSDVSEPQSYSLESFIRPSLYLDNANRATALWPCQNIVNYALHIQENRFSSSWEGVQDIFTTKNFLASTAMAGSSSGQAVAIWCEGSPYEIQAGFFSGMSWEVTSISKDVFLTCLPLTAVAMNDYQRAVLLWNDATNRGLSAVCYSQLGYGPQQFVYIPSANELLQSVSATVDSFGTTFAAWTSLNFISNTYLLAVSRNVNGEWEAPLILDSADLGAWLTGLNIGVDGDGRVYVIWEKESAKGDGAIFYNCFSKVDDTWNREPLLISSEGVSTHSPALAINAYGAVAVAWITQGDGEQKAQLLYQEGNPPPQNVSSETGNPSSDNASSSDTTSSDATSPEDSSSESTSSENVSLEDSSPGDSASDNSSSEDSATDGATNPEDSSSESTSSEDVPLEDSSPGDSASDNSSSEDSATDGATNPEDSSSESTSSENAPLDGPLPGDSANDDSSSEDSATDNATNPEDSSSESTSSEDVPLEDPSPGDSANDDSSSEDSASGDSRYTSSDKATSPEDSSSESESSSSDSSSSDNSSSGNSTPGNTPPGNTSSGNSTSVSESESKQPTPLPPRDFRGHQEQHRFLMQADNVNYLSWSPSTDPTVVRYNLYRNEILIATISAGSPLAYQDHRRIRGNKDVYMLTAVNEAGVQSDPLTLTLP